MAIYTHNGIGILHSILLPSPGYHSPCQVHLRYLKQKSQKQAPAQYRFQVRVSLLFLMSSAPRGVTITWSSLIMAISPWTSLTTAFKSLIALSKTNLSFFAGDTSIISILPS